MKIVKSLKIFQKAFIQRKIYWELENKIKHMQFAQAVIYYIML